MEFENLLIEGTFIQRYKRFLADVKFANGRETTVHCPNPGSMLGLIESGSKVYVSDSQNPKRKLRYTWELVEANQTLVGINTNRTNRLLEEAINKGIIAELSDYDEIQREVNIGQKSRFDLLLRGNGQPCIVEIKSVTLKKDGKALFPDSVTKRGARHVRELIESTRNGYRAVVCFVIQRNDTAVFSPAWDIDPDFSKILKTAQKKGVEIYAYQAEVTHQSIEITTSIPVEI